MKLVPLTIEALGPLVFPERKPGVQFRSSLPYVPGAAIYGALGGLLSKQLQPKEFAALFRSIRCHNAYPTFERDAWVHPLPMTAVQPKGGKETDKRYPKHDNEKARLHRPYDDSLYARVCWECQQPAALIYAPTGSDGRPWEAAGRMFYALERDECVAWQPGDPPETAHFSTREVTQRVLTRVSINRRRGTAEDSRLYSPLVISEVMEDRDTWLMKEDKKHLVLEPTRFSGSIVVPTEDKHVETVLGRIAYLGGRQTTGLGAVQIAVHKATDAQEHAAQLKDRIAKMTNRFKEQAALYAKLGGAPWQIGTNFTINLLSDAILLDQGWLPTNEFSAAMLNECAGIDATLLRSFTTTSTVGGWNVSWQRQKQTAIATNMGSVFVFHVAGEVTNEQYRKLAELERNGIGERRAEGYGQIRICDEFHLLSEEAI